MGELWKLKMRDWHIISLAKLASIELLRRTELWQLRMFILQDLALEMLGHTCVLGAWLCLNCMGHHVWKVKKICTYGVSQKKFSIEIKFQIKADRCPFQIISNQCSCLVSISSNLLLATSARFENIWKETLLLILISVRNFFGKPSTMGHLSFAKHKKRLQDENFQKKCRLKTRSPDSTKSELLMLKLLRLQVIQSKSVFTRVTDGQRCCYYSM